jgi:hypothetical protein
MICRLAGRIGAYTLHSRRDPRETTAAARATFLDRFVDEVDPTRRLPEAERFRRAEAARRAYMAALALKSAVARRKRAGSAPSGERQTGGEHSAT